MHGRELITHKTYDHGLFRVKFSYINEHPHMVICRNDDTWCVIDQHRAWQYVDSQTGAPTPHLIQLAYEYAEQLGLLPTRDTVFKLAGAVVDGIPDLLDMPPWETYEKWLPKKNSVEGELKIDGKSMEFTA